MPVPWGMRNHCDEKPRRAARMGDIGEVEPGGGEVNGDNELGRRSTAAAVVVEVVVVEADTFAVRGSSRPVDGGSGDRLVAAVAAAVGASDVIPCFLGSWPWMTSGSYFIHLLLKREVSSSSLSPPPPPFSAHGRKGVACALSQASTFF